MSEHLVPPGVDQADAALLRRAYDLTSQEESQQLYVEWAATYDRTMVDGLGYTAPARTAERFAAACTWRDEAVLDLGVGTGLVGAELAAHGFRVIDGLDLSAAMMQQAGERGIYRAFIEADMTATLPIPDETYSGAICNGTFTSGHVDARALSEIVRVLRPGAILSAAIHHAVWEPLGFGATIERLTSTGALRTIEMVETAYYETSTNDGRICTFERLAPS